MTSLKRLSEVTSLKRPLWCLPQIEFCEVTSLKKPLCSELPEKAFPIKLEHNVSLEYFNVEGRTMEDCRTPLRAIEGNGVSLRAMECHGTPMRAMGKKEVC